MAEKPPPYQTETAYPPPQQGKPPPQQGYPPPQQGYAPPQATNVSLSYKVDNLSFLNFRYFYGELFYHDGRLSLRVSLYTGNCDNVLR